MSDAAAAGRVLALDYGAARCGCAVSDPTRTLATPLPLVERPATRKGIRRIVGLAQELDVGTIVVGLPLSLSGGDSDQTRETRAWADRLRGLVEAEVELLDERFTTTLAARAGGSADEDSRAAAVLLEDWLARA